MNEELWKRASGLIYAGSESDQRTRFTQDFPILPDVWRALVANGFQRVDVLLTPDSRKGASGLLRALVAIGLAGDTEARLGVSESYLVALLSPDQLVRLVPLSTWWKKNGLTTLDAKLASRMLEAPASKSLVVRRVAAFVEAVPGRSSGFKLVLEEWIAVLNPRAQHAGEASGAASGTARWKIGQMEANVGALLDFVLVATALVALFLRERRDVAETLAPESAVAAAYSLVIAPLFATLEKIDAARAPDDVSGALFTVTQNRRAEHAVIQSRRTVKADAGERVFDIDTSTMTWAIVDSGIDARHPAFLPVDKRALQTPGGDALVTRATLAASRVTATYDFTRLRELTSGRMPDALKRQCANKSEIASLQQRLDDMQRDLLLGRVLDWSVLEAWLQVPHDDGYEAPLNGHGTHVAGIIGADWRRASYDALKVEPPGELIEADVVGICPRIHLLDLRVFDQQGNADEYSLLAALQYLRYRNRSKDKRSVHGVNISISLWHDVENYACGNTPICLEVDRLASTGIVVVAAAGNYGFERTAADFSFGGAFRGITITDPGNANKAITVGSTHRSSPHAYGISYFSSRGPTGDGRKKPDLVAPGEKIRSTIPEFRAEERDGTSMAAPHVSGVAALLMARYEELIGDPERIKDILCRSATDLGREPAFQGAGLVDALRALQSV